MVWEHAKGRRVCPAQTSRQGCYQSSRTFKDEALEQLLRAVHGQHSCAAGWWEGQALLWDGAQQQPQPCLKDQSKTHCLWGDTSTRFFLPWGHEKGLCTQFLKL